MHFDRLLFSLLVAASSASAAGKPHKDAILLSKVQSLTLRGGRQTTHRRVPAAPQLKCISSKKLCDLWPADVMRCANQGAGYNAEDIQWSCTASLPETVKLGSTDVICEGYASRDDPYVLRGSCGVEYRLVLTDVGEQRYPQLAGNWGSSSSWFGSGSNNAGGDEVDWSGYLFAIIFFAVLAWIVWSACYGPEANRRPGGQGRRRGWGGGGGGGGGFGPGWGPGNDPPPPYPGKPDTQQGWQPGFWSGLAGGAAAGYFAGRNNRPERFADRGYGSSWASGSGGGGWGASRTSSGSGGESSSSSSARHESIGFGGTSRR